MDINKVLFQFIKIGFTIIVILLVLYGVIRFGTTAYDFGYRVFTEPAMEEAPGTDILVQIKDNMSSKEIGQLLEDKGLVQDANLFNVQLKVSAYSKKIQPGVYTLNTSMTAKDMMIVMSEVVEDTESTESTNPDAALEGTTETLPEE